MRESASTPGQFVLSGRHRGRIRHLLLVDPEGKACTLYMSHNNNNNNNSQLYFNIS